MLVSPGRFMDATATTSEPFRSAGFYSRTSCMPDRNPMAYVTTSGCLYFFSLGLSSSRLAGVGPVAGLQVSKAPDCGHNKRQ